MIDHHELRYIVNLNCQLSTLCFQDAYELFWRLPIAWVIPDGFYRYAFGGYADQLDLCKSTLSAAALVFGRRLHERRSPVSIKDFVRSASNPHPPSPAAFTAWACRWRVHVFYKIPEPERNERIPFERVSLPFVEPGMPRYGYKMRTGIKRVLILGLARVLIEQSDIPDPYGPFRTPPRGG